MPIVQPLSGAALAVQWRSLGRDLAGARSLRAVLGHLFKPPGWVPHRAGNTTAELRARLQRPGSLPGGVAPG